MKFGKTRTNAGETSGLLQRQTSPETHEKTMLHALLVDDEDIAIESLSALLEAHCAQLQVVATANSVKEARSALSLQTIDVLFLDISMPGESGFELLKAIPNPHELMVVFVTAYDQYAQQALNLDATSYLLKPVNPLELRDLESRLLRKQKHFQAAPVEGQLPQFTEPVMLRLHHQKGFRLVNASEVISLQADNAYTIIALADGDELVVSKGLHHFEALLRPEVFMRIHRSAIINIHHLQEFISEDADYAVMSNSQRIEVSRRRKTLFFDRVYSMSKAPDKLDQSAN